MKNLFFQDFHYTSAFSRKRFNIAITDFIIIAGIFAGIYDPYRVDHYEIAGIKPMDPYVRREVLSHLVYKRTDFPYVHPSWNNDGEAVIGLDLCFVPTDHDLDN